VCKRRVRAALRDEASLKLVEVEGYLHPRGCMKARFTHLDLPLEPLKGTVLGALASVRGGVKLPVEPRGGCAVLHPPVGAPLVLCMDCLKPRRGVAYLTVHRRGWLYLALPGLEGCVGGRRGRGS